MDPTSASGSQGRSASDSASPLGRYDVRADDPADIDRHEVRLLGVPVELFLATRQQHDELVRECAVMGLAGPSDQAHDGPQLRKLIDELGVRSPATSSHTDERVEAAARAGRAAVDLVYRVPASVIAGADRLASLMAAADEFCQQGRMLTMPRTAQMKHFAAWWLDELRRQVGGQPAAPWPASERDSGEGAKIGVMSGEQLSDDELIDLAHSQLTYNAPLHPARADQLLLRAITGDSARLLDVGCGDGRLLLDALADRPRCSGDGVDLNARAVARARGAATQRALGGRAVFHVRDIADWDASADTVICIGTAHAWADRAAGFRALRELTRPGGRLLYGDGFWRREPSEDAVAILGDLHSLEALVALAVDAGWRPLLVAESTRDELDTWESDWRAGLELSGHPQARALADERRQEYFGAYRDAFGFAWLVMLAG